MSAPISCNVVSKPLRSGLVITPSIVTCEPGVINAASYAPFTTGLAPGELVSIYGANLAGSTVVTQGGNPFPTTLGGVQVLMKEHDQWKQTTGLDDLTLKELNVLSRNASDEVLMESE